MKISKLANKPSTPSYKQFTNMNTKEYAEASLNQLFLQAEAQFGSAVKSHWFYDSDACPGCGGVIDTMQIEGNEAISLNGFIYRERGVLIGYVLCSRCATKIFEAAQLNPGRQTPRHTTIESNLRKAYDKYMGSLDA